MNLNIRIISNIYSKQWQPTAATNKTKIVSSSTELRIPPNLYTLTIKIIIEIYQMAALEVHSHRFFLCVFCYIYYSYAQQLLPQPPSSTTNIFNFDDIFLLFMCARICMRYIRILLWWCRDARMCRVCDCAHFVMAVSPWNYIIN